MLQRVVFLDRDGVLNRDSLEYIKSWKEFQFLPGSIDAVQRLTAAGFTNILITNQSAVNRRLISRQTLSDIHARMKSAIRLGGGGITDIFFCPHRPDEDCGCRKPKPGLIYKAQAKYKIDLSTAVMVGDSAKDIACARQAGCRYAVWVRSGLCGGPQKAFAEKKIRPDHVADDLFAAAAWISNIHQKI